MSVTIKPPLNIHSWAKTPFAAALSLFTQSARKSGVLTQDYSIKFRGKTFPCAGTAYQHFNENLDEDEAFELLIEVMSTKLKQYPQLIETITLSGGIDWLKTCFHRPDSCNKFWQGTGYRSGYITALINAYREIAQPPEKIITIEEQLGEERDSDRQKLSNRVFYNPISFELYILFNNKIKAREWGIHLIKELYVGEGFTIQDSSDRDMKFESDRSLVLLDLFGSGLTKLGVDSRLTSGGDYAVSRAWCEAIYHHLLQVDGIRYFSRHDNTRLCCGLFERSKLQLEEKNLGNLIDFDVTKFAEILEIYDYGIA